MSRKGGASRDPTSRMLAIAGLIASVVATLIAVVSWLGDMRNKSDLYEIKADQLLDEAQDLITGRTGETLLRLRVALCARPLADKARIEQARRKIKESLQYGNLPKNHRAYVLLAMVHSSQGDYTGALQVVEEALAVVPDEPMLIEARGSILFRIGRLQDAAQALEKALEMSPGNLDYQSSLGVVLCKLGQLNRARSILEDVVRRDPFLFPANINLGDVLRDQGLLDSALFHYRRAVLLEPTSADAHGQIGYTLALKGDLVEAVRETQSAIDLAPYCGQYFYNMGVIQRKLGNTEVGDHFIQRAKQLGIEVPVRADSQNPPPAPDG